jgi:hypothetical protein
MQVFHQPVKRNDRKFARRSNVCEIAVRRATLDVARDSRGWYKVRAAIDLQYNAMSIAG